MVDMRTRVKFADCRPPSSQSDLVGSLGFANPWLCGVGQLNSPWLPRSHQCTSLLRIHGGIVSMQAKEVVGDALLDDSPLIQNDDPVAAADRGNLVRDNHAGSAGQVPIERLLDSGLGLRVQGAGAIVEQQNGRFGKDRPCQSQTLTLPAGERQTRTR